MSLAKHTNWRDCKAWKDYGVPMSTASDDAAKMYDAVLTQYVGWYDEPSVEGIEKSLDSMIRADPSFVMGHVIKNGLEALGTGTNTFLNKDFASDIEKMLHLAVDKNVTEREKNHVNAVKLWTDGEMAAACKIWEDILIDYPLDMLALKFAHDSYFYLGYHPQMRDSIARVFPYWDSKMPLYGYLYGMHSIGLEECNHYEEAERVARMGLDCNRNDAWSIHSMAHVFEMTGRAKEGTTFLTRTENDWNQCGMVASHNYWHNAVYNIELNNHSEALGIFDNEICRRAVDSGALLNMVDASSLLYRLQLEGVNVEDKWSDLKEVCNAHKGDHVLSFNDAHLLMVALGAKDTELKENLLSTMRDFIRKRKGDNKIITEKVGLPLCEAMVLFDEGDYSAAVEKVLPVKYDIISIGGSHAQRDVFSQFIIHAAMKSPNKKHNQLARTLLKERKALKNNSPLTDRLMAQAMAVHCA